MKRNHSLINVKQERLVTVPDWMGSVLVHLLFLAVILKADYQSVPETEIIWISMSNISMQKAVADDLPTLQSAPPTPQQPSRQVQKSPPIRSVQEVQQIRPVQEAQAIQPVQQIAVVKRKIIEIPPKIKKSIIPPEKKLSRPQPLRKINRAQPTEQDLSKPSTGIKATVPPIQPTGATTEVLSASALDTNPGPPVNQDTPVEMQTTYLETNFAGIRDKVRDNLRYPAMARRQGWHGQVKVGFTILRTGAIENIHILSSSGYSMLDRQALQAIKVSAPFPPPPVVAGITIPVTFELH